MKRKRPRASNYGKQPPPLFTSDEVLVGGYVPRQIGDELALLSLVINSSRSQIVRSLITQRLSSEKIMDMIRTLAERIYRAWQLHLAEKKKTAMTFSQFRHRKQVELETRKINPLYIQRIMTKAREMYEADKNAGIYNK